MSSEEFKIDTKGICLLCMAKCRKTEADSETKTAFKMLLRYLKIDILTRDHFSSSFMKLMDGMDDVTVVASLCEECSSLAKEFLQLFQNFEEIRLQLDNYAGRFHQRIVEGEGDEKKMEEYRRRITTRKPMDMMYASVAEKLRKETMEKCASRLNSSVPKVKINELQLRLQLSVNSARSASRDRKVDAHQNEVSTNLEIYAENSRESSPTPQENSETDTTSILMCIRCGKTFSKRICLNVHLLAVHAFETLSSKLPAGSTDAILNLAVEKCMSLQKRIKDDPKNPRGCPFCPRKCPKNFTLRLHILQGHLDLVDQFMREIITKKQMQQNDIEDEGVNISDQMPGQEDYEMVEGKFKCIPCGKLFGMRRGLIRHFSLMHREKEFRSCIYCGKEFTQMTGLNTHLVAIHPMLVLSDKLPPGTSEHQFERAVSSITERKRRIPNQTARKGKPYGCPLCVREFQRTSHLRTHVIQHHFHEILLNLDKMGMGQSQIDEVDESNESLHQYQFAANGEDNENYGSTFDSIDDIEDVKPVRAELVEPI